LKINNNKYKQLLTGDTVNSTEPKEQRPGNSQAKRTVRIKNLEKRLISTEGVKTLR